jgi:hypothetical protein
VLYNENMPPSDTGMILGQERVLPTVTLSGVDLPDLARWEVGGEYFLVIKTEMISKRNVSESENPEMIGTFKIRGIKVLTNEPVTLKKLQSQAFENKIAEVLSANR